MIEHTPSILVAEGDAATATFLGDNLSADSYEVHVAPTARDALRVLEYKDVNLALIDFELPDASGLELLRRVRDADRVSSRIDPAVPVIVLSGRADELERLRAFDRGADDFVAKPFSYPELRARVAAVLRRVQARSARGRLRVGVLTLDPASRDVRVRGERVVLSQKEFALLHALAAEPTRVFSKEQLLRDVWGFRSMGSTRTLDSHACRLRQKLGRAGDRFVLNVWGVGYRLIDVQEQAA